MARVDQLMDAYERDVDAGALDDAARVARMDAIVAAFDEAIADCEVADGVWRRLRGLLLADGALHAATIERWCAWDARDDEAFPCTARLRSVAAAIATRR